MIERRNSILYLFSAQHYRNFNSKCLLFFSFLLSGLFVFTPVCIKIATSFNLTCTDFKCHWSVWYWARPTTRLLASNLHANFGFWRSRSFFSIWDHFLAFYLGAEDWPIVSDSTYSKILALPKASLWSSNQDLKTKTTHMLSFPPQTSDCTAFAKEKFISQMFWNCIWFHIGIVA